VAGAAPFGGLVERLVEHHSPEIQDRTAAFGGIDERAGEEETSFRVVPSDQRLDGDDVQVAEGHDGLVVDDELILCQAASDICFVPRVRRWRSTDRGGGAAIDGDHDGRLAMVVSEQRGGC
jgi:hypothetical protein